MSPVDVIVSAYLIEKAIYYLDGSQWPETLPEWERVARAVGAHIELDRLMPETRCVVVDDIIFVRDDLDEKQLSRCIAHGLAELMYYLAVDAAGGYVAEPRTVRAVAEIVERRVDDRAGPRRRRSHRHRARPITPDTRALVDWLSLIVQQADARALRERCHLYRNHAY